MATATITPSWQRGKRVLEISLAATTVPNALTEMVLIPTEGIERLYLHLTVATAALTGFSIQAKASGNAPLDILFSSSADFNNPSGLLVGASGDLTTQGVGEAWFIMDVAGIDSISIRAISGGTATLALEGGGS